MLLTVSKRLEFSASRRLYVPDWSKSENLIAFGPESAARYGSGRNYTAYFVFSGQPDPETGMLINISEIKERAGQIVNEEFDHRFLNEDNPVFRKLPPTAENIAAELQRRVAPLFADVKAKLVAIHLREAPGRSATVYNDGACDSNYWFEFSAARRTMSPHLSDAENVRLFGIAAGIHGHNYRCRLSFRVEKLGGHGPVIRYDVIDHCIHSIRAELDHRYLNEDVAALRDRPLTTESLAEYIYERVNALVCLHRVRLHEREDFLIEVFDDESMFLGVRLPFNAAHRLNVLSFSPEQNESLFGKCNNPEGHGHHYVTETTVAGKYNEKTGTVADLVNVRDAVSSVLRDWDDRHLDLETSDFREIPSTGENIVRALWGKLDNPLEHHLVRLRVWETNNNRFTLRRTL
jgi:6-pyruvoyltetrahydropterin/6-carboxytetrahydropterin synthase